MHRTKALQLLGLPEGASAEDIHNAYAEMSGRWRPESFSPEEATRRQAGEKLREIDLAYDLLTGRNHFELEDALIQQGPEIVEAETLDDSRRLAGEDEPRAFKLPKVSVFYIFGLVLFSLGTSAISFCANQALQLTLTRFTSHTGLINFIISLNALNQLWVTPYVAWKSDRIWTRFGRRRIIAIYMTPLLGLCVVLIPHSPSIYMLIALVFLLQIAEDAELALLVPAIRDSVPDEQRPFATGAYHFTMAMSVIFFSRYGMKLMGHAEHWPYTLAGVMVMITGTIFVLVLRERYVPPRPMERFRPLAYGREVFKLREYNLIWLVCFFQPMFVLVSSLNFPLYATEQLGMTKADFGWAFSWGSIVTAAIILPLGALFNRLKWRRQTCAALCLCAVAPLTWGYFFMHNAVGMAIFYAMQQGVFNTYRLSFLPLVLEYTTPKNAGTVMGVTTMMNGLVRFTMYPLMGLLVDAAGKNYRLPLLGGYVGVAVCVTCFLLMRPAEAVRSEIEALTGEARPDTPAPLAPAH